ncbi:MAG: nucleotidyltransferase domain-containing protein [Pontiellaceae bacterium]|nr:nucleotidyltransferase domain-containing protein [Pontiellaceae bacterium]
MKTMSPEQFTEQMKSLCGSNLQAVILYGSAAAGDYVQKGSDYNLLVLLDDLGPSVLRQMAKPVKAWGRAGNPPPLLFTPRRLAEASDVFTIELLDMRDAHQVLFGDDVICGLQIDTANLRLQIERELRSALIQLRRSYLPVCASPRRVAVLLTASLSSVLALFHAALRLYETPVPSGKFQALEKLNGYVPMDIETFRKIHGLKTGELKRTSVQVDILFEEVLKTIEVLVDAVDQLQEEK